MNFPGPNAKAGVELATQGYKREALRYLRLAVMHEPVTPDLWLWLAHVTDDVNEYRYCVSQALALQSNHPTALQMQNEINYQAQGMPPPVMASDTIRDLGRPDVRQRRIRRVLVLLTLVLMIGLCGLATTAAVENINVDDILDALPVFEPDRNLQFTVEVDDEAFDFAVTVPQTWFLADSGSQSWQDERERLEAEFPTEDDISFWASLEADLSLIERDEDSGELSPPVVVTETRSSRIESNDAVIGNLTLLTLEPSNDTDCDTLRDTAADELAEESRRDSFVGGEFLQGTDDNCTFFIHFRGANNDGFGERRFDITIPAGDDAWAVWRVTVPDELYNLYDDAIDVIIDTLRYREE